MRLPLLGLMYRLRCRSTGGARWAGESRTVSAIRATVSHDDTGSRRRSALVTAMLPILRSKSAESTRILSLPVVIDEIDPSSVKMFSPVICDAASLLRKIIGHACSEGDATRPVT